MLNDTRTRTIKKKPIVYTLSSPNSTLIIFSNSFEYFPHTFMTIYIPHLYPYLQYPKLFNVASSFCTYKIYPAMCRYHSSYSCSYKDAIARN